MTLADVSLKGSEQREQSTKEFHQAGIKELRNPLGCSSFQLTKMPQILRQNSQPRGELFGSKTFQNDPQND